MSEDIPVFVISNEEKDKGTRIEAGDIVISLDSGNEYAVEEAGKGSSLLIVEIEDEYCVLVGIDGHLVNDRFEKMEHHKQ